ncbi:hypothetical protein EHI8A_007830 [Entamoeba histolytica HM-1:IMSS-B]|uniref:Peptidase S74 domain-containing protein n=6 Tax=Entamoeba histolytica TaxID=5759 RepID=C4LVS2_ENTH1|nr:hypothetical protein EHI_187050 [Entamoeba histolytica HM-1:IMSS]EMD47803.1 Hypothetical protein EHI5A_002970 [Entamoeba histolytica KU27]EMH77133.1 hypothetical protein EHI8A_007830 [Entamoeba histolytica HM-1:IMSS-B]EMS16393.1 hypothetical protein KM1_150040 [Entamoeba histolytica HM-3:IMSS]ENY62755.1 hypothetical protein EHI7A_030400 [Entamoeba histolytica HM-1:IMSS-A]GAT92777.1 hypothetical protein CL6EHI_187050 [Entamoeba histolytica]|eukprot:XP_656481.1 hypothetical protein EHI_187050 [Entamoeba histolytica HM-1:IMSS]
MSREGHRIRYKEYKCTFPGCNEPAKTKYNCISHVWDGHLKLLPHEFHGIAYKSLPEEKRKEVKSKCLEYITFVTDTVNQRKRKPYKTGLGDTIESSKEIENNNQIISITPSCNEDFITIQSVNKNIKRLCIAGELFSEAGFFQRSDQRNKNEIQKITGALEQLKNVVGYSFVYKNDENNQKYGFMAQELQKIYPNTVKVLPDGTLSIDTVALLPYIVSSLKELYTSITELNKVTEITQKIKDILKQVLEPQEIDENELFIGKFGLGPKKIIWWVAIIFTILSIIEVICIPSFGMIWIWTIVVSFINWLSYWKSDWNDEVINNKFNKEIIINIITRWYIIISIGLIAFSMTFLMGSTLQIYMSIVIALNSLIVGLTFFDITKKLAGYLMIFSIILALLLLLILSFIQPSYSCLLSSRKLTQSNRYIFIKEQPPWNCMAPSLHSNSSSLIVDYTKPFSLKAIDFGVTARVELKCENGISFTCGNVELESSF